MASSIAVMIGVSGDVEFRKKCLQVSYKNNTSGEVVDI